MATLVLLRLVTRTIKEMEWNEVEVGDDRWVPPKHGTLRVDTDACYNVEENIYGVGVIIRGTRGEVVAALATPVNRPSNVLEGEIEAIKLGIGLCIQNSTMPFEVFSDSINAILAIRRNDGDDNVISDDVWRTIASVGSNVLLDFKHMRRGANRVAHNLAALGARLSVSTVWKSEIPCNVMNWVRCDVA